MDASFNLVTEKEFIEKLESVMDSKGLNYILMQLENICNEKSTHCAENWQDHKLSRQWFKIADKIENFRLTNESKFPL